MYENALSLNDGAGMTFQLSGSWTEEKDYPGRFFFRGPGDTSISIQGSCMHVIALEIDPESDVQEPKNRDFSEDLDHLWATHQPDKGFDTSIITDSNGNEREVIIYMLPHGR